MRCGILLIGLLLSGLWGAGGATAFTIELPRSAEVMQQVEHAEDVYDLPSGPFADGALPTVPVQGHYIQRSWRIIGTSLTTVQIVGPQREALQEAGFEILLDCASVDCGGFDFRFATRVLPAPAMFVDIFQYRFVAARHPDGRAVSILVSIVSEDAYVQVIQIAPAGGQQIDVKTVGAVQPASAPSLSTAEVQGDLGQALITQGYAVLDDLQLASGSDQLQEGDYASLSALADFLKADPARKIVLVGHTDAVGGLEANIALSKRRAASVVARLKSRHQVSAAQVTAAGMGYLAPRTSNLTIAGRQQNRRVVAVLLNTK